MPAAIRIPVVASMDASWDRVFSKVEASARRARKVIASEADAGAKAEAAAWKEAEIALAKMEKEKTDEVKKSAKARVSAEKAAMKETEQAARAHAKTMMAEDAAVAKAAIAASKAAAREAEANYASMVKSAKSAGSGALGIAGRAIGFGASIAGDIARGAGVDLDVGSHFKNAATLETTAANLSNQGVMANDPRNAHRVDPGALQQEMLGVGSRTGHSGNEIGEAMGEFVSRTGDLATARATIEQIGVISKATGTDITDMAAAAGEIANAFGDAPDKAQKTADALKILASQGKVGAVEIKDLATQAAKLTASAGQFEGDTGKNIAGFGALAQLARKHGGATSATMAATSVSALTDTFSKGARLDAFAAHGVNVKGAGGKTRNIEDIIADSLSKTRGNDRAMGEMFSSTQARRAVRSSELTYKNTFDSTSGSEEQKNTAAIAAVRKEFDDLAAATMDGTEIQDSFNAAMETSESKATVFNNSLDALAIATKDGATPALEALTPVLLNQVIPALSSAAIAVAQFAAWFASTNDQNTGKTVDASNTAVTVANADAAQLKSGKVTQGQYDTSVNAEKDLQKALDAQGEDKQWSKTSTGRALTGFGGEATARLHALGNLDPHALDHGGTDYAKRAVEDERLKDARSDKSFDQGRNGLSQLHDINQQMLKHLETIATNSKVKGPPAGNPSPTIPAVPVR